jgi:Tfp pilus assembly protein FimV
MAQPLVSQAAVPARPGRRAVAGDRVHVVVAGESLWSIASDVLGGRATVAQVAREVNRLWELNRVRIGTGNRDLLPVGTRLVLK